MSDGEQKVARHRATLIKSRVCDANVLKRYEVLQTLERPQQGLLRRLGYRNLERDRGAVFPEPLERVIHAIFVVENVRNDVTEVEQNPPTLGTTLTPKRLGASL